MNPFQTISERNEDLSFSIEVSNEVKKFAATARETCNPQDKELSWDEVVCLANFATEELNRGAENLIDRIKRLIVRGQIKDEKEAFEAFNFNTAEGYIAKQGAVTVLTDWLLYSIPEGDFKGNHVRGGPNWDSVRKISSHVSVSNVLSSYALLMLDKSLLAFREADMESGVSYMALAGDMLQSARFYSGINLGEEFKEEEMRERARAGGIAKNRPMSELRVWVWEQYQHRIWPSPYQASFHLAPIAIVKAKELGTTLSNQRAQQTIYEWLRKELKLKAGSNVS